MNEVMADTTLVTLTGLEEATRQSTAHAAQWQTLDEAAACLRAGGLVVIPTETVYGLGANGLDPQAIQRLYAAKGRPSDNPLILHVPDLDHLTRLVEPLQPWQRALIAQLSPGPITYVLKKKPEIPDCVTAGLDTVGVRIPSHPIAQAFIKAAGVPVAAPSANRSGRPSPTTAADCWEDLAGRVAYILDGGPCKVGVESTVIDLTSQPPRILRPGQISLETLQALYETVTKETGEALPLQAEHQLQAAYLKPLKAGETPAAPGMKYRHYAPTAGIQVLEGQDLETLLKSLENWQPDPATPATQWGYYGCEEGAADLRAQYPDLAVITYGPYPAVDAAARGLFAAFRTFDRRGCTMILTHLLPRNGVGEAYVNRLLKASGGGKQPVHEEG